MIGPNPENAWFHHWWHWWHSFVTLSMFRDVSRPMSFVEIFSSLSFSVDLIWSTEFGPDVSDSHPTLSNQYLLLFLTRSNLFLSLGLRNCIEIYASSIWLILESECFVHSLSLFWFALISLECRIFCINRNIPSFIVWLRVRKKSSAQRSNN